MTALIVYSMNRRPGDPGENVQEWHVGERWRPLFDVNNVKNVQADGDELDFILSHFENIPSCTMLIQYWYDSDAKFIAGNMQNVP